MRSNLGHELPGIIDPSWNWTTPKGKQRAVRRARTSFAGWNIKNSMVKSFKRSADTMDMNQKRAGDISVSESEKVSVSILGRHFSDTYEIVPIKKRRFLLTGSPLSPLQSSYSNDSDHVLEGQTASYQESPAHDKNHDKRIVGEMIPSLNDINEEATDGADFSGISILAAAACSSEMLSESRNAGGLLTKEHCCKDQILEVARGDELQSLDEDKEEKCQSIQDVQENYNSPLEICHSSLTAADEKLHNPGTEKIVIDSSQNVSEKTNSSSCDSRLHWDLNVAMDAWNHEVLASNPVATDSIHENNNHNEEVNDLESLCPNVEDGENTCPTKFGGTSENMTGLSKDNSAQGESEFQEKPDACYDNSIGDHEKTKLCGSLCSDDGLFEENLDATSISLVRHTEEEKVIHNQAKNICNTEIVSPVVRDILGSLIDAKSVTESVEKAKANVDCVMEKENSILPLPFSSNTRCDSNDHVPNSHMKLDQSINELGNCLANVEVEKPIHPSCSKIEVHGILNDSDRRDKHPIQVEKASDILFDSNVYYNSLEACNQYGESVSELNITSGLLADESLRAADKTPCTLNSLQKGYSSCNPDELSSGITTVEQATLVLKVDNNKFADSVAPISVSAGMPMAERDVHLVDATVSNQDAQKSCMDPCVDNSDKVALDVNDSDAPHDGAVHANGLVNSDIPGDDDSQFEDGEFRESILQSWGDGADEGESERVDYGSDNGENTIFDAVSGFTNSDSSAFDHVTCKNMDASVSVHGGANTVVNSSLFGSSQFPSKCSSRSASSDAGHAKTTSVDVSRKDTTDCLVVVNDRNQRNGTDGSHSVKMNEGVLDDGIAHREPSTNGRTKMSGWDQFPVGCVRNGDCLDAGIMSVKQDATASALNVYGGISVERSSSSYRKGLPSRIERCMSLDESERKDRSYNRGGRSDHGGLSTKTERNISTQSARRGRSSQHNQGRGRDEQCHESSNHHGPRRHDSTGYCDSASYARSGSRNATAAAVAKVESNGFVVAADGTIVRAGGTGNSGRMLRQPVNSSSQNRWGLQTAKEHARGMERRIGSARDMVPDRHFTVGQNQADKYGHEMVRSQYRRPVPGDNVVLSQPVHRLSRRDQSPSPQTCAWDMVPDRHFTVSQNQADKYGHEMVRSQYRRPVPGDNVVLSQPVHRLSRRDQSPSPLRRLVRLSRSRSRSHSRSRTRSPHQWSSSRRRSETGINDISVFHRHSRSPKGRAERMRSPHPRPSFEDHIVGYSPTSRGHASSLYSSSRWFDEGRNSPNHHHHREHEYKRSRRSPSIKVFRNQRVDSLDSQGRSKAEAYYRPLQSSKDPEVAGLSRGYGYAGNDDRREYGDRYESLWPMRQYNIDNNDKRFRSVNPYASKIVIVASALQYTILLLSAALMWDAKR
ncbi:hypothetical protein Cni_G14865 [Canna indica]|uniref:Uncharacterized protein n=1 Tax=Canna indica TaxID=4628 RepID=A0AAQ3QED3_9LILI|nr:hypothetical protein Cni_G14865 [Canna indica]